jgi:sulfoacetaldehyde dehydrogenase
MINSAEIDEVDLLVGRARTAQQKFEKNGSQQLFDIACQAVGWALMEPTQNKRLAELAVRETGLGNVTDKIKKNHNKTLGLLRDLKSVKSFGHVAEDKEKGLSTYLRPKGVVAAIVPSTNPLATPVNNIINALKCGNAIIVAPSPKGAQPLKELLVLIHKNLSLIGLDNDLVQMVPLPPSKGKTNKLMQLADMLVVTGSQNNVKAGYSSGTPALGVGQGNVVTIIDETADVQAAAAKIAISKTFDNATSCSSENSVIAIEDIYEKTVKSLNNEGGLLLNADEADKLIDIHWKNGKMTTDLLAQDIDVIIDKVGLKNRADKNTKFLVLPLNKAGATEVVSGEKMSRFLTLYKVKNFSEAIDLAVKIQNYQGAGHSLGIHTQSEKRAHEIAMLAKTCRVIVNQAHCFATGGFFNNGLPFSLSMGCGSWGGNSIDGNLNWEHFVNKVRVVRTIEENKPELEDIFEDYWGETSK